MTQTSESQPGASQPAASSSRIHWLRSIIERLDLNGLFPQPRPVEVELGAGDGSFLLEYAKAHPEHNFLGIERLLGRIRKIDRKSVRRGLHNLRLISLEASYFVEYMLPPSSVSVFHIYFPDPWPKRRHHKHRLIQTPFVTSLHRALKPGGEIYLRTDNLNYFVHMRETFLAQPKFTRIDTPADLKAVETDFERQFRRQGAEVCYAAYQKRDSKTSSPETGTDH